MCMVDPQETLLQAFVVHFHTQVICVSDRTRCCSHFRCSRSVEAAVTLTSSGNAKTSTTVILSFQDRAIFQIFNVFLLFILAKSRGDGFCLFGVCFGLVFFCPSSLVGQKGREGKMRKCPENVFTFLTQKYQN